MAPKPQGRHTGLAKACGISDGQWERRGAARPHPDHKVVSVHLAVVEALLLLPSRLEMVRSMAPDGWKGFSQLQVQSTGSPLRPVVINKKGCR